MFVVENYTRKGNLKGEWIKSKAGKLETSEKEKENKLKKKIEDF